MQSGRLGVTVGLMPNTRSTGIKNTKEMREVLVTQTQARGYHAMLRRDGCEGRRFRQFMERGELRKKELEAEVEKPFAKDRMKKLEQRGLRLAAILDLVPSLFYSGWIFFPGRRQSRPNVKRDARNLCAPQAQLRSVAS